MSREALESTCKQFLDSLLNNSTRHVLCLNISEPGFEAERIAADYLASKGKKVTELVAPAANDFADALENITGKVIVASFDDLDKHPKCIDALAEHVKRPHPKGMLVVVSRQWNSDNTAKERELRKSCLFYQQNQAVKPKQ
jgi:hypothetical protein